MLQLMRFSVYIEGVLSHSRFGDELRRLCFDTLLCLSDTLLLPSGTFTFISSSHDTVSWLDHVLSTTSGHSLFSSFFFFRKKLPIVVVRDVCPSVRPSVCPSVRLSVRLSSVEIFSFRGNSLSSKPIDLKIGLNVREGVVHVRKA